RLVASNVHVQIKEITEASAQDESSSRRYPVIETTDLVKTADSGRRSLEIRIAPVVLQKWMIPQKRGGYRDVPLYPVHGVPEIAAHALGHGLSYSVVGESLGQSVPPAFLSGERALEEYGFDPADHLESTLEELELYDQYYNVVPDIGLGDYPAPP